MGRSSSKPELHLSSILLLPDVSRSFFSLSSWGLFSESTRRVKRFLKVALVVFFFFLSKEDSKLATSTMHLVFVAAVASAAWLKSNNTNRRLLKTRWVVRTNCELPDLRELPAALLGSARTLTTQPSRRRKREVAAALISPSFRH